MNIKLLKDIPENNNVNHEILDHHQTTISYIRRGVFPSLSLSRPHPFFHVQCASLVWCLKTSMFFFYPSS